MSTVAKVLGGIITLGAIGIISSAVSALHVVTQATPTPSAAVIQAVAVTSTITPSAIPQATLTITSTPSSISATPKITLVQVAPTTTPHVVATTPTKAPVHITATALVTTTPFLSNDDYYTNVDGNSIHAPVYSNTVPAGATAQCGDGTYSFSQHHSGTCSHHGGVAEWL